MHLHLRDGDMLRTVAPLSAAHFAGAVIMPNLVPPVDTAERLATYEAEVRAAVGRVDFTPLMTLFFRPFAVEELREARSRLFAVKLYPAGATTNSETGVRALDSIAPTLALLEDEGIPLLVHGETADFVLDRERAFLPIYAHIAENHPRLRLVMEHITTREAVEFLDRYDNVFATVTLHHLLLTLDDVAGGLLAPHLFCKPIAKRPEDRAALLAAALAPHPKLMFGSDSAPHPRERKECAGCAAGLFTAPVALPLLAELFARHNRLDRLQAFVSDHARRIHGLALPPRQVTLVRKPMDVPPRYGSVVPFRSGATIPWSVAEEAEG
jgi:dihydroorotase